MAQHSFPDGFLWGAATSAQQIEGACREGGRGPSIWDVFAAVPGNIADGSVPDVACDHYHRYRQDIGLMAGLGLDAYRFSIAWPRVLPTGRGPLNPAGLDFYDRLVDSLLEAGLQPFPTLFHWDLPQALQEQGGFGARDIVEAFADYAAAMARHFGDRVRHWTTHNEPWCFATLGHEEGCHAPGHKDPTESLRVAHHLLLSHGRAVAAIRDEAPGAEVGIVLIHCPSMPATDSAADQDAARWFDGFFNRWYLDPIYRGFYPADAVADRVARGQLPGPDLPFVNDGDLAEIAAPLDFLGMNYYSRSVMRAAADGKPEAVKMVPDEELTDMEWEVYPQGLHDSLMRMHNEYGVPKIFITENGAAYDYPTDSDGRIRDNKRIDYLRGHLLAAQRAVAAGVPLAGYFTWSLLDNFEWALGYEKKFGIYGVDQATGERQPKDSARWYGDVVSANSLSDVFPSTTQGESSVLDD